jgi:hypothetical protein
VLLVILGRYPPESGLVMLILSFVDPDPLETYAGVRALLWTVSEAWRNCHWRKATEVALPSCPVKARISLPVAASHSRAVLSSDPVSTSYLLWRMNPWIARIRQETFN